MKKVLQAALAATLIASSLSACVPLMVGGAAVGATTVAVDRRSSGAYVDDQSIELKATSQMSRFSGASIGVTSYNRAVLLTGQVPTQAARDEAELLVRGLPNVRRVYNHLTVGAAATTSQASNDTWITSKVRTNMLSGKGFSSNNVKVVTELGVVYLMGMMTRNEGEAAAKVASETAGVTRVVTLFETISDAAAAQAQPQAQP